MIRFSLMLALLASFASAQVFDKAAPGKKSDEVFKNITTFKGEPSTDLEGSMVFMSTALGVKCEFCHDVKAFDADTKNPKKTAREMVTMQRNVNKDAFRGQLRVTCYSCHQGHQRPVNAPTIPLPAAVAGINRPPQGTQMPAAADLFAKYETALGGSEKLAQVKSRVIKGTRVDAEGKSAPTEFRLLDGDKIYNVVTTPEATLTYVSNGKDAWSKASVGSTHEGDELAPLLSREAELVPAAKLKSTANLRIVGTTKVGERDAYVVAQGGGPGVQRAPSNDQIFFDKDSGLLLRQTYVVPTVLGPLPTQIDYEDYRAVDGVQVPYRVKVSRPAASWTINVTAVEKTPVKESQFEAPK